MKFELSLHEGRFLVRLARKAAEEYLKTREYLCIPESIPKKLLHPCGVFVTINKIVDDKKELRGCIGYPYPTESLVKAVIQSAVGAAAEDPRFSSLSFSELEKVCFEVSVLTPPQEIEAEKPNEYLTKIKIGEDGLIIERGMFKGLLLPQVPVEWKWCAEEFLCQCCIKAGLPPDNWLLDGTKLYKFQAMIFEEEKPKGEVKRKAFDRK